ncbi:hypothetical protein SPHINGOR109_20100 [Sphingorhabdus sp. 109]|nr:hypothetical protein SPHINGOR109_20100 [Sphingorhabdus sp. 109]
MENLLAMNTRLAVRAGAYNDGRTRNLQDWTAV